LWPQDKLILTMTLNYVADVNTHPNTKETMQMHAMKERFCEWATEVKE
jgi:hypothetical protein